MAKGLVNIYAGDGKGKSPAALGRALQAAMEGKSVVILQFLKGNGMKSQDFLRRMEPEIKLFCFEKADESYENLSEEEKQEEIVNIKNEMNFAKKVLITRECDLLILDEVLRLVEKEIVSLEDLKALLECRGDTDVILTGKKAGEDICALADMVSRIETWKPEANAQI
ncbi:MAG: cob(I)yrinic acid a c-diamide adenosyltransferase [Lachnospiraceae bacterium]|nr:cob(I)yrinic acid a,c-diamide adenosyltransferase [uncultured Acetatifactor sp.]MCI9068669.1 cob(I)yrinic acid a c-diamide adenosyltransferase [Lachnospiraceae bacterium]